MIQWEERSYFPGNIKHISDKRGGNDRFKGERERERVVIEAGSGERVLCYELLEEIEAISGRRETLSAIKSIESRRWEKNGRH